MLGHIGSVAMAPGDVFVIETPGGGGYGPPTRPEHHAVHAGANAGLKLALVAASVLFASLVARRFGHAMGGTVAGMPMIAGPIMGFLVLQSRCPRCEPSRWPPWSACRRRQCTCGCFAWCAQRWPWALSWLAANLAFFAVGLVVPRWSPGLTGAVALAAGSLLFARWAMPQSPLRAAAVEIPKLELALRVIAAVTLAWVIVRGAGWCPPP